MQKKEKS